MLNKPLKHTVPPSFPSQSDNFIGNIILTHRLNYIALLVLQGPPGDTGVPGQAGKMGESVSTPSDVAVSVAECQPIVQKVMR